MPVVREKIMKHIEAMYDMDANELEDVMKTTELSGAALDWAVAKAEGMDWYVDRGVVYEERGEVSVEFQPSTNWAQGGAIIEREHICLMYYPTHWSALAETGQRHSRGATPLEAAMRCYVTSKLGSDVTIPEELK